MERETSSEKVIDSKEIGNERINRGTNRDSQFAAMDCDDYFHDVDLSSRVGVRNTQPGRACRALLRFSQSKGWVKCVIRRVAPIGKEKLAKAVRSTRSEILSGL
jgi:hypothetical protein